MTFMSRFARGRRLDRNPLRRASDRAETVVLTLLLVAFLVGAPLAALASGARVHAIAQQEELAQQASRHQVTATVVNPPTTDAVESGNPDTVTEVRWAASDGRSLTGQAAVPTGTQTGTRVPVWTTRGGQLVGPPLAESQVKDMTILAGTTGVIAVAAVLGLCGLLVRWSLNRRRMAAWDVDWRTTGPRWTTRR
jgi:hypothetical protein